MTVESATYIDELDDTLPAGSDQKAEGDNHIRLLKTVLQASFPNVSGAANPSDAELNYLVGVSSAIQTQINNTNSTVTGKATKVSGALDKVATFDAGGDLVNSGKAYASIPSALPVPLNEGGTGSTTQAGARSALGLLGMSTQDPASVSITGGSISIGALDVSGNAVYHSGNDGDGSGMNADLLDGVEGADYAQLASPTFTGDPKAPTPAAADSSTSLATTAFVGGEIATAIASMLSVVSSDVTGDGYLQLGGVALMIAWGSFSTSGANSEQDITFPVEFSGTPFHWATVAQSDRVAYIDANSTTGMTVNVTDLSGTIGAGIQATGWWFAIGKK